MQTLPELANIIAWLRDCRTRYGSDFVPVVARTSGVSQPTIISILSRTTDCAPRYDTIQRIVNCVVEMMEYIHE